ncbi:glycosyltransferase family 4 protein [Kineococcus sp. SYSU DK005]|uniref:glycosyltransferase family 4 protein n=1 Tax=Kineococcus sp. SYSU DK005 TaxID=3383126 RepID=UPI003D7E1686
MKVLVVLQDANGRGGTERTALLATAELRGRGHEVHLLHGGADPLAPGLVDAELREPSLFDFGGRPPVAEARAAAARVREHVRAHGVDLVHVHGFPRADVRRTLAAGRPVVVTAHNVLCPTGSRYQWGTGHVCDREIGLGCLTSGYRSLGCGRLGDGTPMSVQGFGLQMVLDARFRRQTRTADAVVAPSAWMRGHLLSEGAGAQRVHVVEPPITAAAAVPAQREGERADADALPVVSFVGRLVAIKGVDVLLRASARVPVPHRLVLAGDGGAREELRALVRELGIEGRTRFEGAVTPAQADALRRRSAVVAVPSVVPETFGMVGPEALLAGVPVVAHDFAGASGWIAAAGPLASGVSLRDVDAFAAALTRALQSPPPAAVRAEVAGALRERYSVHRHVDALLGVYRGAAAARDVHRGAPALDLAGPSA